MKRKVFFILLFLIGILLITIVASHISKKEHHIHYSLTNHFQIEEYYTKEKEDQYYFEITNDKQNYHFTISGDFSKQKKIIKQILLAKEGTLTCILPIYQRDYDAYLYCNLGKQQVSNSYLLQTDNNNFKKILEQFEDYKIKLPQERNQIETYKKVDVYPSNIGDDETYFLWNYKGLITFQKSKKQFIPFLDYDLYDNVMATTLDHYYVLFENSSVKGIETIYYYDFKKESLKQMKLDTILSKDSYINGVNDHLIYVTDNKKKRQYTINIKNEEIIEIDNDQTNYIIYREGEKKDLSKSDFFLKKQDFQETSIGEDEAFFAKDSIYYWSQNKLYKSYIKSKENTILLLELENIKDWKVIGDTVLLLQDTKLYSYSEEYGLRVILESNELKYNYKNIYNIGKKD